MGTTSARWGLPAPALDDPPDGPDLGKDLADALDTRLGRALPVADSAARTALVSTLAVGDHGLWVLQDDTDAMYYWTGAALLGPVPVTGGGGGVGGGGRWAGSAGQPIENTVSGLGTAVSLPDEVGTPTLVTRTTHANGHKFAVTASGLWACGATVRVATSPATGEISAAIWADPDGGGFDYNIAHMGGLREGLPRTFALARTTYLAAGTQLAVFVYNGTGTSRTLEPGGGAWVNLDLWLVG